MNSVVIVMLVIIGIAAVILGLWLHKKHKYIKAIEAHGWTWVESPGIGITVGLNTAPFGIGFARRVDDQVIGRGPSGVPFQAFRYVTDSFRSNGYVVCMKLPKSLPSVAAFAADMPREGISGALVASTPLHVVARRPDFGTEFAAVLLPAVPLLRDTAGQPMRVYQPRDDSMLGHVNHTGGGFNHKAVDIISSANQGIPFIRLTHTWQTQHTTTDSKGNTTTHTQNHSEDIAEFQTTFAFRPVSVNWGMLKGFGGNKVEFESTAFNQQFKVRCPVPRFASDVFHPRQLEYFLRTGGLGFSIEQDGLIRVEGGKWSPAELDRTSEFLHGFFARIPDFAWKELGAWPRPIAEIENHQA